MFCKQYTQGGKYSEFVFGAHQVFMGSYCVWSEDKRMSKASSKERNEIIFLPRNAHTTIKPLTFTKKQI